MWIYSARRGSATSAYNFLARLDIAFGYTFCSILGMRRCHDWSHTRFVRHLGQSGSLSKGISQIQPAQSIPQIAPEELNRIQVRGFSWNAPQPQVQFPILGFAVCSIEECFIVTKNMPRSIRLHWPQAFDSAHQFSCPESCNPFNLSQLLLGMVGYSCKPTCTDAAPQGNGSLQGTCLAPQAWVTNAPTSIATCAFGSVARSSICPWDLLAARWAHSHPWRRIVFGADVQGQVQLQSEQICSAAASAAECTCVSAPLAATWSLGTGCIFWLCIVLL